MLFTGSFLTGQSVAVDPRRQMVRGHQKRYLGKSSRMMVHGVRSGQVWIIMGVRNG